MVPELPSDTRRNLADRLLSGATLRTLQLCRRASSRSLLNQVKHSHFLQLVLLLSQFTWFHIISNSRLKEKLQNETEYSKYSLSLPLSLALSLSSTSLSFSLSLPPLPLSFLLSLTLQRFCFFPTLPNKSPSCLGKLIFLCSGCFSSLNPYFQPLWVRGKVRAFQQAFWHYRAGIHLFGCRLFTTDLASNMFLTSG